MGTVSIFSLKYFNPSIAEETEIAGVITPSASSALPPMMAGIINHFTFVLRTSV